MSNLSFAVRGRTPPTPGKEARIPGSNERFVGRDGHINASSKKDAQVVLSKLMALAASGEIDTADARVDRIAEARKRQEKLVAAYHDRNSDRFAALGANLAATVSESADREGFMRRLLVRNDLALGQRPQIRVRKKNVTAVMMTTDSALHPQFARETYLFPQEFSISAHIRVEHREINQGSGDLLEEKFYECQEAIMVQEDRRWKQLADGVVNVDHQLKYLVGGLNPASLQGMRTELSTSGVNAVTLLMSADFWNDIIANTQFSAWFDPVTKYEIITTGELGSMLGLSFITDGFRQQNLRVLEPGEMYMISDPLSHGGYTDRGPVQSHEVNNYSEGSPARGWYMWEDLSMIIANTRSVIKAKRA